MFLFPFTIVGLIFAIRMWTLLPAATRKYLAEVEGKSPRAAKKVKGV
jgi:OPA family glycerol-3-phosphate transporter-like MFS transporter